MLVVGSCAIKNYYSDFREPKDIDVIVDRKEKTWNASQRHVSLVKTAEKLNKKIEYLENPIIIDYLKFSSSGYVPPDVMLTLKASHLFWNINWYKHVSDVMFLIDKGHKIIRPLFYKLYDYWNEVHGKNKRSDLKMTAEEFFDNALKSDHDHDYLHTLINPSPTYMKVLADGAEVEVSEEKFNALSFEEKCDLVREEVMVMAYERFGKQPYFRAYNRMIKKFIINHAPLWEAIFIIENFKILKNINYNFFKKINNDITRI